MSIDWRASLVPAAAVIPAPIAYIKVVAVKKFVVGFLLDSVGPCYARVSVRARHPRGSRSCASLHGSEFATFTLRKLECSRQANAMNILAWNNNIGPWFYFVGF